jgi:hypothetical protein
MPNRETEQLSPQKIAMRRKEHIEKRHEEHTPRGGRRKRRGTGTHVLARRHDGEIVELVHYCSADRGPEVLVFQLTIRMSQPAEASSCTRIKGIVPCCFHFGG